MDERREFGNQGESLAADFLKKKNYKILESQYKTQRGEIDLICLDGNEVVFVEVKTRRSDASGYPEESVTHEKIKHLIRAAYWYMRERAWEEKKWRIDIVAIQIINRTINIRHIEAIDMPEGFWYA